MEKHVYISKRRNTDSGRNIGKGIKRGRKVRREGQQIKG